MYRSSSRIRPSFSPSISVSRSRVGVERVVEELLDDRVAVEPAELLGR